MNANTHPRTVWPWSLFILSTQRVCVLASLSLRVRASPLRAASSSSSSYYHIVSSSAKLASNPDAAIGNPLKGLMESPQYNPPPYKATIPLSLEFYYVGTLRLPTSAGCICKRCILAVHTLCNSASNHDTVTEQIGMT
jgi:hypothetical protein